MTGLQCLNDNYEELSVIIAKWSYGRKGLMCDCFPSCTEMDLTIVNNMDNMDRYVQIYNIYNLYIHRQKLLFLL